jgi:hypothetical protein
MFVALSKDYFDQLDEVRQHVVSQIQPSLYLGEPGTYEDPNGNLWYGFSDGRWERVQIAMLGTIVQNVGVLKTYDSDYVDDETGEISDHDALHQEAKTDLQDSFLADPTMTLPENVEPLDPVADRPSFEDVRAAQEKIAGDLDSLMQLFSSVPGTWARVDEEVP